MATKRILTEAEREAKRVYHRDWCARNKDKVSGYGKARRERDPETARRQEAESRERNKEGIKARRQAKYYADVETTRASKLAYYYKNHEENKRRARVRAAKAYPTTGRSNRLLKKFGITTAQWEELFEAQNRRCANCESDQPGCKQGWVVDHSHPPLEFKIRGILCWICNVRLGQLGDHAAKVAKMCASYLRYLSKSGDTLTVQELEQWMKDVVA